MQRLYQRCCDRGLSESDILTTLLKACGFAVLVTPSEELRYGYASLGISVAAVGAETPIQVCAAPLCV